MAVTPKYRSDFHNIMYVMHVFHTEDDVQYLWCYE